MPNLMKELKSEITRLAKKEAKKATSPLQKRTVAIGQSLAASKRRITELEKEVTKLKKLIKESRPTTPPVSSAEVKKARFGPTLLKSQRKRLKINQHQMAKLMNVSVYSVRAWEQGRSKPRDKEALVSLVAIRKMTLGQVREHLGIIPKRKKRVMKQGRKKAGMKKRGRNSKK